MDDRVRIRTRAEAAARLRELQLERRAILAAFPELTHTPSRLARRLRRPGPFRRARRGAGRRA